MNDLQKRLIHKLQGITSDSEAATIMLNEMTPQEFMVNPQSHAWFTALGATEHFREPK